MPADFPAIPKTIGDAYMCVAGIPSDDDGPVENAAKAVDAAI